MVDIMKIHHLDFDREIELNVGNLSPRVRIQGVREYDFKNMHVYVEPWEDFCEELLESGFIYEDEGKVIMKVIGAECLPRPLLPGDSPLHALVVERCDQYNDLSSREFNKIVAKLGAVKANKKS